VRTITVTGTGSSAAAPDTALIRLSAVHRARSFAEALAGAESAREEVVKSARELVVSTVNLSVWPTSEQGQQPGFEARHTLTIATGDLKVANELLTRLAYEVGTRLQVEGVDMTVLDPSAYIGRAREAAFADARSKAEHLAALADATLGQVEAIAEGGAASPMAGGGFAALVKEVGLQPGETKVTATLTVTWSLG
jgi:uncharacterized protein YggE